MGIVQRQGIQNTILSYAGVLLGMVNKLILFNAWLTKGQFGLIELLATFMVVGSELSQLGVTKIIARFFPYFHKHPVREGSFVFFVLGYTLGGYLLLVMFLEVFRGPIMGLYAENAPLFSGAYGYILPITLSYTLYRVLGTLSQSLLKSVIPNLTFHVVLRLAHMGLILLYHFEWLSLDVFLSAFVWSHFIPGLIVLTYLLWLRKPRLRVDWRIFRSRPAMLMYRYGLYSSLGEMALILIGKVDLVMLGWMVGEASAGTYAIAFYIASLIQIPGRALGAITHPLVAGHLKNNRLAEIQVLYQKSSINGLVACCWVLIGLWVNLGFLFELTPKHADGYWSAILLGISALLNVGTGINRSIIINSRYFRFDLWANIGLLVVAVGSNLLLIPRMGITGAAVATTVSIGLYNLACSLFVWARLRMQPFTWQTLGLLGITAVVLGVGMIIPPAENPLISIILRSVVVTALYVPAVLIFRLSSDISGAAENIWSRLRRQR
ncbi:MAG: polysaccharide biosynthesis C-terminal domain-containing protein [Bacteroidia bacterium]|nr:polysaccharide biosynthesis C-terminal domain-containing protein [Bacteroidia bacterium]